MSWEAVVIPAKYAGGWIAWDSQETEVVAVGDSFLAAWQAAQAAGEPRPILEKVPAA